MAGRPTDYKIEYADQAEKLCKLGATDAELAEFFDVVESTINLWKLKHPEFSESIKAGKILADANVAQSLYKRANGFDYDEIHYEKILQSLDGEKEDDDIKLEVYKKKVITKMVVPDTPAAIFWLKNRQKQKWRDKVEQGFTDGDGNDVAPVIYIPDNGRQRNTTAEGLSGEGS